MVNAPIGETHNVGVAEGKRTDSQDDVLDSLKVDESTLIAGMRYEDLNTYEKKSVLVSSFDPPETTPSPFLSTLQC